LKSFSRFQDEVADFFTALAAAGVVDAGVGFDSGRAYFQNRSLDVLSRQPAGEHNRFWIEGVGDKRIDERR
jgi:hypothetical protein